MATFFYAVADGNGMVQINSEECFSSTEKMAEAAADNYFEHSNNLTWPINFKIYNFGGNYLGCHEVSLSSKPVFTAR